MPKAKKRYEYKLNLGKGINGQLIRKSFYSTKSMADARKKAEEYRLRYEMELFITGSGQTRAVKFSSWALCPAWRCTKSPTSRPTPTAGPICIRSSSHLIPYFGNMNLQDIRPIHIQQYLNEASGKYAPETG